MARNVIANRVAGSEAPQVAACQARYQGGWSSSGRISACTKNAVDFLSRYDLFGLQEIDPDYREEIEAALPGFLFVPGQWILTGYNPAVTGPGIPISSLTIPSRPAEDQRGIQAVWFPFIQLLFINLHAPHGIDLKHELELSLNEIEQLFPGIPDRVLIVGDFNDWEGRLTDEGIRAFGRSFWIPRKTPSGLIFTCCADVGYQFPGDYILVDRDDYQYYGLPPGYIRGTPLMSDHDPVVLFI